MSDMLRFPEGFLFGASTSAYQIEGAAAAEGKGPSIWDEFSHRAGKICGGSTGDTACDHYHRLEEDLAIMADLGLQAYRFSISWPRILPEGRGSVNQAGLDFYDRLTDGLLARGIQPFPTLFHWDLPLALQKDLGGFANRSCCELFADYSEIVVDKLGDRIKNWITINEPFEFSSFGHTLGSHAPGRHSLALYFKVMHHLLLAHGLALQRIKARLPDARVGAAISLTPIHPASDSKADAKAALLGNQLINHISLSPLFKGSYPEPLWHIMRAFRPPIQTSDMAVISRPMDFIGINNYQREFARHAWYVPLLHLSLSGTGLAERDFVRDGVQYTSMGWEVYPDSIYQCLKLLKEEYGNPPVYITENGAAFEDEVGEDGSIHDAKRRDYLASYLGRALAARKEGSDLRGYFVWSLLDNFEWAAGFTKRFGLVHVDYASQKRRLKDSALWYRDLIAAQKRP